jgi:putative acetyltransferase
VSSTLIIKRDDLSQEAVIRLLEEHLAEMQATSPPESKHALDLEGLRSPLVNFWTIWDNQQLAGCAAYQKLDSNHAEIKSMRTSGVYRGCGIGSILLIHLIKDAKLNGFKKLSLETGSMPFFAPARAMYEKHGFNYCGPFGNYVEDPYSQFMSLDISSKS